MPITPETRDHIIRWIRDGVSYSEIIKRAWERREKISKGGITYLKKKYINKITEQKDEKTEQLTEQEQKIISNPSFTTGLSMIEKNLSLDKIKYVKTLSDLEFKNFKQALFIITKSNFHRLKSNKARGILGALNVLNNTLAMMEKRGDYNS